MVSVYQLISNPYKIPNPFVYAIIDGIENLYDDIKWGWGYEKFWTDHVFSYDIVLVHWPETPLYWDTSSHHTIDDYIKRIEKLKSKGIKIVSFVHNIVPHYTTDEIKHKCYDLIYSSAYALLHMGRYSQHLLANNYPQAKHFYVGPHYVYNQVYRLRYTRAEALAVLGLDSKYKYILAFGTFRDDEEREMVYNLAQDLKRYDKYTMILAPSFKKIQPQRNRWDIRPRLQKYRMKNSEHIICNGGNFYTVSDSLLPCYYAVADVCLIHRKKILNSGNVPMAFLMGKVVSGPDVGNVGEILREMNNPFFDPNDRHSVVESVIKALELSKEGKGEWNHDYAMKNFSTEVFCKNVYDIIESSSLS